jgi:hypothetical protein
MKKVSRHNLYDREYYQRVVPDATEYSRKNYHWEDDLEECEDEQLERGGTVQQEGVVESEECYDRPDNQYFDGAVSVWDCGRKANLNLSASNAREVDQRVRKLDKIIEHCEQMKIALEFARSKMK